MTQLIEPGSLVLQAIRVDMLLARYLLLFVGVVYLPRGYLVEFIGQSLLVSSDINANLCFFEEGLGRV